MKSTIALYNSHVRKLLTEAFPKADIEEAKQVFRLASGSPATVHDIVQLHIRELSTYNDNDNYSIRRMPNVPETENMKPIEDVPRVITLQSLLLYLQHELVGNDQMRTILQIALASMESRDSNVVIVAARIALEISRINGTSIQAYEEMWRRLTWFRNGQQCHIAAVLMIVMQCSTSSQNALDVFARQDELWTMLFDSIKERTHIRYAISIIMTFVENLDIRITTRLFTFDPQNLQATLEEWRTFSTMLEIFSIQPAPNQAKSTSTVLKRLMREGNPLHPSWIAALLACGITCKSLAIRRFVYNFVCSLDHCLCNFIRSNPKIMELFLNYAQPSALFTFRRHGANLICSHYQSIVDFCFSLLWTSFAVH